ncbi:EF-hand domain-containing protein [Vibrio splendidus]|nr:EF-hand domain-containing protein [Vibrio splendidus]MCC4881538.1 EF-hand domain-containing protein [Vibrio splendidus]
MKKILLIATTALLMSAPSLAEKAQVESSNIEHKVEFKKDAFFERFDTDLDSYLNESEWETMKHVLAVTMNSSKNRFFAKADVDTDGVITAEEMKAMKKQRSKTKEHNAHEHKSDKPARAHGERFFNKLDRDGDGKVTRVEFMLPSKRDRFSFDRFDKDDDKLVSKAEFINGSKKHHKAKN